MYLVPNGMYKRAAWVGSLEVETEGARFTILTEANKKFEKIPAEKVGKRDRVWQRRSVRDAINLVYSKMKGGGPIKDV